MVLHKDTLCLVSLWVLMWDWSVLTGPGSQREPATRLLLSPGRRFEMTARGLKPLQLVCFSSSVHLFSKNFLMLCPARPMSELSSLNFSQLSNTRLTSMMNVSKFWYLKNRAKNQLGYCICISLLKDHETVLTDVYVSHMMDSATVLFVLMLKRFI